MRKRIIFTLGIFTRGTFTLAICTLGLAPALPAHAQDYRDLRRATDAAIASDIARDRQAERDARRQPYVSPGYGPIQTATAARNACAAKAREEAGPGAKVLGRIAASPCPPVGKWKAKSVRSTAGGRCPSSARCAMDR